MGSLRHNKMQQAGAKNGVKQTRLSMARQTQYSEEEMDYKKLLDVDKTYSTQLESELSSFTPSQLQNVSRNDTIPAYTKFNSNKVPLDLNTNFNKPEFSNKVNKGINSSKPTLPAGSATITGYSVVNPIDKSLNRTVEQTAPKAEYKVTNFSGDVKNKNRASNSMSSNTQVQTYSKPVGNTVQPISELEFNANKRKIDAWNKRKESETNQ